MEFLFLIAGVLLGAAIGFFIGKKKQVSASIDTQLWVEKSLLNNEQERNREAQQKLEQQQQQLVQLNQDKAILETKLQSQQEKLNEQKAELSELNERFKNEFQVLANKILDEKSQKFVDINNEKLGHILNPLREKIEGFEKQVKEAYYNEAKEKATLKNELEKIVEMNRKMSEDAERLTNALKGDSKTQGDWGEVQLERILEHVGLQKGLHYETQNTYKNEEGSNVRPDYIIKLPEDKHIILDAKVSLTAYERYFNAENDAQKAVFIKEHVQSLVNHIQGLSAKQYQNLEINQPDYVMLFVPIEPALYLALKESPALFEKALEKNVVLVSTSTLMATLRTIAFIWTQDNQKRNVLDIAKESGLLYDKFVGFMEDLNKLGHKINGVQADYQSAMKKISEGRGNLVGKVEKIKALGAKATKQLDAKLLERAGQEE